MNLPEWAFSLHVIRIGNVCQEWFVSGNDFSRATSSLGTAGLEAPESSRCWKPQLLDGNMPNSPHAEAKNNRQIPESTVILTAKGRKNLDDAAQSNVAEILRCVQKDVRLSPSLMTNHRSFASRCIPDRT
jgi:hypothetical protein